ncbi:hypothetical protein V1527DRAFT_498372 [Lipomyces starkeyi]
MKTSSTLQRHQKYLHPDADTKCRSSIGVRSRRAALVPVDPNQTQANRLLAPDPATPGSDTDLGSIFGSDIETYTDSSPPDSPCCEPWFTDYFERENESGQPHRQMIEPVPERPPTPKPVDDYNSVHNLLVTPSLSTRKAANIDIISADVEKATNSFEAQRDDENKSEMPLTHGMSSSQVYSSISGFMFRHVHTTPGLRRMFETRDHRRGSNYMKEEVKVMYDTITRHRSLGCDERSIADPVVLAVYSWRGDR